jgi:hypothetical protein
MFKISLSAGQKAELQISAICNKTNGLKFKILKRYLEAGNRFLPAHTFVSHLKIQLKTV